MDEITDINAAWIRLYEDKAFKNRILTVSGLTELPDLKAVSSDDGKRGFNDRASSVKWLIPRGWKAILFDDNHFRDSTFELAGTGKLEEIADLGSFNDKTSSIRWEQW